MTRQGFSFLVCADPELIKDRVTDLLRESEGFTARTFWGDEDLPETYWQALAVPPMMGPPCAVVLRRAQELEDSFWTKIHGALAMARKSIWPIFCLEGDWKAGKSAVPKAVTKRKFWAVAQQHGWIWEHPGLTRQTLGREIDRFAARHGLRVSPPARHILIQSLPLSTIALRQEMEKILLLAMDDKEVLPLHLATLAPEDPFDIFSFLRAIRRPAGEKELWARLLGDPAMTSGDMLFPLTALLVREARQLWMLAHGEERGVNLPPRIKAEKRQLANQLGPLRISRFWDLALQADTSVKTGRLKPAQALEALISGAQRL